MTNPSAAELVLQKLGITKPGEIDLEAIAWHLGAKIKVCELDGCEARILGYRDKAIIRIDGRRSWKRRRFSCAHELGHWHYHRGQLLFCRSEDIGNNRPGRAAAERAADYYAADLLLPRYLFVPLSRQFSKLNFKAIRELADEFQTSITATAIRVVETGHSPAILLSHSHDGLQWFRRSPDVPEQWFPRHDLDQDSFAFELLFGTCKEQIHPRLIDAEAWFEQQEAQGFSLREQSVRTGVSEILTLLRIDDERMLEER